MHERRKNVKEEERDKKEKVIDGEERRKNVKEEERDKKEKVRDRHERRHKECGRGKESGPNFQILKASSKKPGSYSV